MLGEATCCAGEANEYRETTNYGKTSSWHSSSPYIRWIFPSLKYDGAVAKQSLCFVRISFAVPFEAVQFLSECIAAGLIHHPSAQQEE